MGNDKAFNEKIYRKYILDKLNLKIPYGEKERMAIATGYNKSNLSSFFSMKKGWGVDSMKEFAMHPKALNMSEIEFMALELEARMYEFRESKGKGMGEKELEEVLRLQGIDIHDQKNLDKIIEYAKFIEGKE